MIVDGKTLAEEIKASLVDRVAGIGKPLRLAIVRVGSDAVTEKFLEQKKKFGASLGVEGRVYHVPVEISTSALRKKIAEIVHINKNSAVVIQLPLPQSINTQYILDGVTPEKDADMLSSKSAGLFATNRTKIVPPVVGAVKCIFEKYHVELQGKRVVVVGRGRLVGKPLALWLLREGCALCILDEHTPDLKPFTLGADIVMSGVGKPKLITSEMVKDGVIAVDAGISEAEGRLVGDFDSAVADKASLFTPVPGGIGPLTIAMLFSNIVSLIAKK